MPGEPRQRPYYEFEHEGERKTIEADTWRQEGWEIIFSRWVIEGPTRRENEIARFTGVDYKTINRVIP